jgi:hypothetical protein
MVGIRIWNPICNKIVTAQIINSFHGIYNQSIYRFEKSVYLVKTNECKCMKLFLVSDSMINNVIKCDQLKDIYNDLKIKYPIQLHKVDEPPSKCCILNVK